MSVPEDARVEFPSSMIEPQMASVASVSRRAFRTGGARKHTGALPGDPNETPVTSRARKSSAVSGHGTAPAADRRGGVTENSRRHFPEGGGGRETLSDAQKTPTPSARTGSGGERQRQRQRPKLKKRSPVCRVSPDGTIDATRNCAREWSHWRGRLHHLVHGRP